MDILLIILIMLILLLIQGFFSGSEIALVNADKIKLHAKANRGHQGSKLVLKLFENPDILLTTTLVGTNLSIVALSTLGTLLMINLFGEHGGLIAFLVFTPLFLTFGEVVPKSIYQQNADKLAPIIIYPLRAFKTLLFPIIFMFSLFARLATRIVGKGHSSSNLFINREQMRTVVDMADRGASIDVFDRARIQRAIRFGDITVGEAMRPLADIVAINRKHDIEVACQLVRKHGYNRLPVYENNIGNITGILTLTVWDLMEEDTRKKEMTKLVRPAHYVSPLQNIDALLPILRERDDHMAIVVDEFGSAIGMISMEDIFEEVVSEINVGYDFDEYRPRHKKHYIKREEEVYDVDSRVSITEINELLEIELPATEFHTLGGFVETRLRRIPVKGDSVEEKGWRFTVDDSTERAIVRLRVERI